MTLDGTENINSSQLKITDLEKVILRVTKRTKSKYLTRKIYVLNK